jgi:carboxylesterase
MRIAKDLVLTHENGAAENATLILHGLTGGPRELSYLASRVYNAGYDVHCPVLPGHVRGINAVIATSWHDWIDSATAAYDDLAKKYKRVFVGGVCFGGVLAGAIAAVRSGVPGVFMHAPILHPDGWNVPWYRFFLKPVAWSPLKYYVAFPERVPYGVKSPQVRRAIEAAFANDGEGLDCFPIMIVAELIRFARYYRTVAHQVTAPLLICHSVEDDLASLENAQLIYALASSTKKKFVTLKDSYHLITIDNERKLVASETVEFLNGTGEIVP